MGRVYAFENGVLMLRNISAPFLNALDVRWKVFFFQCQSGTQKQAITGGQRCFVL